jgi:hypothetical protein
VEVGELRERGLCGDGGGFEEGNIPNDSDLPFINIRIINQAR